MSKILYHALASLARKGKVWTDDKVVLSACEDVEIPTTTLHEYVFENLDKWETKTAVVCGITNRQYTYEQVYKHSRIFGANLRSKLKIKDGDSVAMILPNCPEFPIAVFGVLAAGGIVVTMNPEYTAYEFEKQIGTLSIKSIITHPDVVLVIRKVLEVLRKDINIIAMDVDKQSPYGTISFNKLIEEKHVDLNILNEVKRKYDDVAVLMFSSGTTGLPKAVELTHFNIVANCRQQDTELRQYSYTTEDHQDTMLIVLPMFHSYAFSIIMIHKMSVGVQLITLPKFQPESLLSTMLNYKINFFYVPPPIVLFLSSYPEVKPKHLENLNVITAGGAPLPAIDIQRLCDKAKRNIHFKQAYGMTEAGPLVALMPLDEENHESVGYLVPNITARIVDDKLNNLGPNKVKGFQVSPAELESVIKDHPDVVDAAVLGIPHPVIGETPKAFVVLKQYSRVTEKEIISFVSEKVVSYKRIKEVQFVDSVPKNASGKILRKSLKEMYLN